MDFSVGRWKSASGGTNGPREGVLGERSRTAGFVEEGAGKTGLTNPTFLLQKKGYPR